jgi:hypothetical protein
MTVVNRRAYLACTCGGLCEQTGGQEIHPTRKDLWGKSFYLCQDCGSYVGSHPNGTPFGTPANERTRKARRAAHEQFDYLWQNKLMSRSRAYQRLKDETGIHHISWEDHRGCQVVAEWAQEVAEKMKPR